MLQSKTIACVIPARLHSTRFPKKILALLDRKPLIQWVWEAAKQVSLFDSVVLAIDSEETAHVIDDFGGEWVMTDPQHKNGTERLIELKRKKKAFADIWVNWQGDEPFINEEMLRELLETVDREGIDVWSLRKKINKVEDVENPHVVKVVCDAQKCALYFSRSAVPHYPANLPFQEKIYYKHIGLYAFTKAALDTIATLPPSALEEAERLEQLRFLDHGLKIFVQPTLHEVLGIDLPQHLTAAESLLPQFRSP